jgi:hypothetical protein
VSPARRFASLKSLIAASSYFIDLRRHLRRQIFHAINVSRDRPQFLVRIPHSIGKHSRSANPMFRDPENLRLGVFRPYDRKLRRIRVQRTCPIARLARCAVATVALIQIHFSARDQILIGWRDRISSLWRFPFYRSMHGPAHKRGFEGGSSSVGPDLSTPKPQINYSASHKK